MRRVPISDVNDHPHPNRERRPRGRGGAAAAPRRSCRMRCRCCRCATAWPSRTRCSRSPSARSARSSSLDDVLAGNRMLVMVASKEPEDEEPGPDDLYRVGVVGVVARMMKVPDGTVRILVQCGQRVELGDFVATDALPGRPHHRGARRARALARAGGRSAATCRPPSRGSSRSCRTCPRSCSSRSRTSTTPRSWPT